MTEDTAIGGPQARFPETRHSALRGLQDEDAGSRRQSYETVVASYWKPVYKYIRLRWNESNERAKDLTQSFFAAAIEKETLTRYDPGKAAFRTYLRTCLDSFVLNARKHDARQKRGGDVATVELDAVEAPGVDPEELFHREWVRSVFEASVDELRRARGSDARFLIFEAYDLCDAASRPSYEELGKRFGVTTATVTNYLTAMRRDLRTLVLAKMS